MGYTFYKPISEEQLRLGSEFARVDSDIALEKSERIASDTAIVNALHDESTLRAYNDDSIIGLLNNETLTRHNSDTLLAKNLADEVTLRSYEDAKLQTSLAAEQSARSTADSNLESSLASEQSARSTADSNLQTSLASEQSARSTADSNLQNSLAAEQSARTTADSNLQNSLASEQSARYNADALLTANKLDATANAVSATKLLNARTFKVSLDSDNTPSFNGTSAVTIGTSGILPVAKGGTSTNNLNNITVGGANRDGSGNVISSYYMPKSGGSFTGAINTANNTWNSIGDDVAIGDHNVVGGLGILGLNGNTKIDFCKYGTPSSYKSITYDGTSLHIDGTSNNVTGIVAVANGGTGSNNLNNITVGGANRDGAGNNISQTYLPTVTAANTYLSKTEAATIYISKTESVNASNADKLSTARNFKVSLNSDNFPNFDGSANVTIGTSGILPVAKGGTNATDLNNITVGAANRDGSGNVISSYYMPKSGGSFTGNLTAPRFNGLGAHYYGTCSTDPDDSNKIVTCPGFVLTTGVIITVNFSKINRASTVFLNVNGTGNIQVITSLASTRRDDFFELNSVSNSFSFTTISNSTPATFVYNGTYWFLSPESHAVSEIQNGIVKYANLIGLDYLQLGQANCDVYYGYCSTAASTAAKVVYCPEITSDTMTTAADFYLFVKFDSTNSATNITFNVNSTGAYSVVGFHDISTHINSLYFRTNNVYVFKWKAALQKFVLTRAFHYLPKPSWYITCSTDAATAAKINDDSTSVRAYCNRDANRITLNLINTNTASNPTLNINRTGTKPIYYGATRLTGKALKAGIYDLIYDSTAGYYRVLSMPFTSLGTDSVASEGAMWISWN